PAPAASARGVVPTLMAGSTAPEWASILVTLFAASLATQVKPEPNASASAPAATGITFAGVCEPGTNSSTVRSPAFATQSLPGHRAPQTPHATAADAHRAPRHTDRPTA